MIRHGMAVSRLFWPSLNETNRRVLEQRLGGLRYICLIGAIFISILLFIEWRQDHFTNAVLRIIQIGSCVSTFLIARLQSFQRRQLFSNVALGLFALAEIESHFHGAVAWYYAITWMGLPVALYLSSLTQMLRPGSFITFWLAIVSYYLLRISGANLPVGFALRRMILAYASLLSLFLACGLQFYMYHLNAKLIYSNLRAELFNKRVLKSSRRALAAESQQAALVSDLQMERERNLIFADLHDDIGAPLGELMVLCRRLAGTGSGQTALIERIEKAATSIQQQLRNNVNEKANLGALQSDFVFYLQGMLIQRYTNLGRQIFFHTDATITTELAERLPRKHKPILLAAIKEIATNDIKYGIGATQWSLLQQGEQLMITLQSPSSYHRNSNKIKGVGRQTIRERLDRIGGTYQERLDKDQFEATLTVPLQAIPAQAASIRLNTPV
ncbi:MAG: hypothetical protein KDK39_09865 [Leptospiraceae bacterium]|nr:hypothetical protein [Leptospiraceae bacterium]